MKKIIISTLVIMNLLNQQCYTADNSFRNLQAPKIIPLTKGLLTKIPIVLLKEKHNWTTQEITVQESKHVYLAEIIATQHVILHSRTYSILRPEGMFSASIVKVKKDGSLINCGTFNVSKHTRAIEALRSKQGAFISYKQGVIIYWTNPEQNIDSINEKIEDLKQIADQNFPKELLYDNLPVIFKSHSKL